MKEFKKAADSIETPGYTEEQMRFYLRREDPQVNKKSVFSSGFNWTLNVFL